MELPTLAPLVFNRPMPGSYNKAFSRVLIDRALEFGGLNKLNAQQMVIGQQLAHT